MVVVALRLRNGTCCRAAAPPEIDAQQDFWTYATILAALLHDVGKPTTDLRIELIDRLGGARGDGCRSRATSCGRRRRIPVGFAPKAGDYGAHRRLPVVLMQRIVPASTMAFLGREPPWWRN